jgi:hypothetical protein
MTFARGEKPTRDAVIGVRFTIGQVEILDAIARDLGLERVELIRRALDYWIENDADAKRAARRVRKGAE